MFDLFPMIQPRQFSIASSPRAHPNEIHLCVAIVKYQTRITEPRYGQCTHMLARTTVGQRLPIWIMKGTIFMPKREDLPMLMIGPGTGVAPFRGFIGERLGRAPSDDATDGRQGGTASAHKSMLVFGNRKQEKDYLFGREWEAYRKSNQLDLVTAFSRDQPDKVYVQHEMINRGKDIWDLIHNGKAVVYVCGNSKRMPDDVKKALRTIAQTHAPMTEDEASSYITQLETARRLQLETWA
ncbi:hypothetical protein SARC_03117 [Sphaeroforma arctica JP610]|uniref:FAD-binding FR-type domain-containing protein n=1 Tax=Sphaeroforma arctica JP610 TaxID=667725 RepID=A0A0L0G8W7_9EUKA|nr:hypothetical protein SARC_03117 [Sphaeroforma arctica JP610]KNC84683.1 hypothetical protein SARC_03117 [Sphaeroforma arctica JP610]|eukprot:XP_014158585.1 hypothetical protein SARC_03117 [Sphaeroforma arctica JP610]